MNESQHKLNAALKQAVKGKLSRREFTQLALASGLTLAAANTMFSSAARAEPQKGGTLKIGVGHGATTDSMDPGTYPDQFTGTALWGTLANSLTEIDADGNVVGDIAESFESSDGAKKWVFKVEFNEETRHNCLRKIRPETVARMVFGSCYKSCSMG